MRRRSSVLVIPWLVYVAVTVAGPALNGAWERADFAEHVLITGGGSTALLLVWWTVSRR